VLSIPVLVSDGSASSDPFSAVVTVTGVNDAPLVSDIPDQTITRGELFDLINLGMYVEDIETPDSLMSWTVLGASKYSVNISNQMATVEALDNNWTGSETLIFIARDDDSGNPLTASDEVEFTINIPVSREKKKWGTIGLYPNPSSGEFFINTYGESLDLILSIYDSQGRLLRQLKYEDASDIRENLYDYPSGIYHIKVMVGDHIRYLKYMKH
jgi:hypothetical protein